MIARYAPDPALARAMSLAATAAVVAVLGASPQVTRAAQDSGSRSASAALNFVIRIPVVLKVRAVRQPSRLDVSDEDALRGYVDVDGAIALEIVSNSRRGFGLRLQAVHPVALAANFLGVASPLHAVSHGEELSFTRVAGDPTVATLRTGARITLAPGTAPGIYPWPVAIAAHAN
jgi:hypothetical protein